MPGKLSIATAVSSVIASMIGAGIFLLPRAVGDAGWVCGFFISLFFGWVLFTMPALSLSKCCELCEELEWLQKNGGFGSGNPYPGSAVGSRQTALSGTSSMPTPGSSSSAGLLSGSGGVPESRAGQLRQRRASQAMGGAPGSGGAAGGNRLPSSVDSDDVDGRTYPASRPIVDSLITSGHVVERVVVSEIHTNYTANGLYSGEQQQPQMIVEDFIEEEKTVFFIGDVAEVAVGRWCRYVVNILSAIYLLFAAASFILLLGDAVHQLWDNGRLLTAKSNADFAKVYLTEATEKNGVYEPPEKPSTSLWIEAAIFTAVMCVVVQIPDVSYIARISFVGTGAALCIVILFFISPFMLHMGSEENAEWPGHRLALKPPNFESVWPQPLVANAGPSVAKVKNFKEATPEDMITGTHQKFNFVWQNHEPKMYEFKKTEEAGESMKKVLSSLGSTGFGYAFATLVPYIRADMQEPAKMTRVIWIATVTAAAVYSLVVVAGLLASGQEYTLVGGSALEAMKFWETKVIPVRDLGQGGVEHAVQQQMQENVGLMTGTDPSPLAHQLEQEKVEKYLINDLKSEMGRASIVTKKVANTKYYFLLFRDPAYFFNGLSGGTLGKATIMSFLMAVFLLIKLLISYPLTVWPVLQDAENMAKCCCGKGRSRNRVGSAREGGGGTRNAVEETAPLVPRAEGSSSALSSANSMRLTSGQSVRVSTRRVEIDADGQDASGTTTSVVPLNNTPLSGASTTVVATTTTTTTTTNDKELPLWGRILARVVVVAITFGITCVFACKRSRLGAVTGFAASVPGMIAMVMFPLVAQNLLEAKVRKARGVSGGGNGVDAGCCGGLGGRAVAQMVLHGFLVLVALTLVVYQTYMTCAIEIKEGFSGGD